MTPPYMTVYTKSASGMGRGDYDTHVHPKHAEIKFVQQSLNEGDRMVFHQVLEENDAQFETMLPIKFYLGDDTKIFDGQIISSKYIEIGNDYKILETVANGWWHELSKMDLPHPVVFADTDSPNDIFVELVRLANDRGVMKEAVYKYDTNKIPGYLTHSSAYTTATGTELIVSNVYEGMQMLTRFLDVADVVVPEFEFGLRIETLPRTLNDCAEAIVDVDVDGSVSNIYILPFILDANVAATTTFKKFKLATGATVLRDYRRLANNVFATGDGVATQQIRTTKILSQKTMASNDESYPRDAQVLDDSYLRVTIENPTGTDFRGWVVITRVDGVTNPTETFTIYVPAGGVQCRYTSDRTADGLPTGNFIRVVDYNGGKITVEEVTNDNSPYNITIAGKSINENGTHSYYIEDMWLDTQARVDYAAGKHCRLYHAPTHVFNGEIQQRYIEYDNIVGCTSDIYSSYEDDLERFVVTDVMYSFEGKKIEQMVRATRYEYGWEYPD